MMDLLVQHQKDTFPEVELLNPNIRLYKEAVKLIAVGKELPQDIYIHQSALPELPKLIRDIIATAENGTVWTIVKLNKREPKLSLLNYPEFDNEPYPALKRSVLINLGTGSRMVRSYGKNGNPPILHRKELFVLPNYPLYDTFCEITQSALSAGLSTKLKRTADGAE